MFRLHFLAVLEVSAALYGRAACCWLNHVGGVYWLLETQPLLPDAGRGWLLFVLCFSLPAVYLVQSGAGPSVLCWYCSCYV